MKFLSSLTLASIATVVYSQTASLGQIPPCAASCVTTIPAECGNFNIQCICSSRSFIDGLGCCVSKVCSASDINATIAYATALCATYQVTVPSVATCDASNTTTTNGTSANTTTSPSTTHTSSNAAAGFTQFVGTGLGLVAAGVLAAVL